MSKFNQPFSPIKHLFRNAILRQVEISITKPSKATYSSEIIARIVKSVGASTEKVIGEFTSKMPLKLTFELRNAVKIEFFMAPRVED